MKRQSIYLYYMSAVIIMICFASRAFCDMSSDNYSIPTSVFPGGGVSMSSANYRSDSTLAQPSTLREPSDPPESTNYALYPGFWYTTDGVKAKNKAMPWILLLLLNE